MVESRTAICTQRRGSATRMAQRQQMPGDSGLPQLADKAVGMGVSMIPSASSSTTSSVDEQLRCHVKPAEAKICHIKIIYLVANTVISCLMMRLYSNTVLNQCLYLSYDSIVFGLFGTCHVHPCCEAVMMVKTVHSIRHF